MSLFSYKLLIKDIQQFLSNKKSTTKTDDTVTKLRQYEFLRSILYYNSSDNKVNSLVIKKTDYENNELKLNNIYRVIKTNDKIFVCRDIEGSTTDVNKNELIGIKSISQIIDSFFINHNNEEKINDNNLTGYINIENIGEQQNYIIDSNIKYFDIDVVSVENKENIKVTRLDIPLSLVNEPVKIDSLDFDTVFLID